MMEGMDGMGEIETSVLDILSKGPISYENMIRVITGSASQPKPVVLSRVKKALREGLKIGYIQKHDYNLYSFSETPLSVNYELLDDPQLRCRHEGDCRAMLECCDNDDDDGCYYLCESLTNTSRVASMVPLPPPPQPSPSPSQLTRKLERKKRKRRSRQVSAQQREAAHDKEKQSSASCSIAVPKRGRPSKVSTRGASKKIENAAADGQKASDSKNNESGRDIMPLGAPSVWTIASRTVQHLVTGTITGQRQTGNQMGADELKKLNDILANQNKHWAEMEQPTTSKRAAQLMNQMQNNANSAATTSKNQEGPTFQQQTVEEIAANGDAPKQNGVSSDTQDNAQMDRDKDLRSARRDDNKSNASDRSRSRSR